MTDELNLKDPAVIERLKAADVSKQAQPDVEAVATEKALKENKPKKVTLELSTAEVQKLTLLAAKANQDLKDFVASQIRELCLTHSV